MILLEWGIRNFKRHRSKLVEDLLNNCTGESISITSQGARKKGEESRKIEVL